MPTIPTDFLDLVAYLYMDEEHARAGKQFGGCGFFVGVQSAAVPDQWHVYFVSNYHVAVSLGFSCLRVNLQAGGVEVFPFDVADWTFIPGLGDIAAIKVPLDSSKHQFRWLTLNQFAAGSWLEQFGVGADIFMMGRFIDNDGGQTNRPAVRFGHVSIMPTFLPDVPNSDPSAEYYCLDMHSRSGFSGSPVSAYKTIANDLAISTFNDLPMNYGVKLLAIHCGQFPEELPFETGKATPSGKLVGYSGMTYALPCSKIAELLNCKQFSLQRALIDQELVKARNLGSVNGEA